MLASTLCIPTVTPPTSRSVGPTGSGSLTLPLCGYRALKHPPHELELPIRRHEGDHLLALVGPQVDALVERGVLGVMKPGLTGTVSTQDWLALPQGVLYAPRSSAHTSTFQLRSVPVSCGCSLAQRIPTKHPGRDPYPTPHAVSSHFTRTPTPTPTPPTCIWSLSPSRSSGMSDRKHFIWMRPTTSLRSTVPDGECHVPG